MKDDRLYYLDSLRGLAAISVVASHFVLTYGLPQSVAWMGRSPLRLLWDGALAVSLFFVSSGFVLARPFLL